MTEQSTTVPYTVVENSLYEMDNAIMIAISETHLVDVYKSVPDAVPARAEARLLCHMEPGEWGVKMANFRETLTAALAQARRLQEEAEGRERHLSEQYDALGRALLAKAVEKDWCEEYDEFAQEWDLPTMRQNFQVTMTVTVEARNEEDAMDIVQAEVGLASYDDHVVSGPDYGIEGEMR